jgi:hypothetical protein
MAGGEMTRNKYNASKVEADGYTFDSKAEYRRYCELRMLEMAGEIEDLKVHPKFRLLDGVDWNGKHYRAVNYFADFEYYEHESEKIVIEDVKGVQTTVFRLKLKLLVSQLDESIYEFRLVE